MSHNDNQEFENANRAMIQRLAQDPEMRRITAEWMQQSMAYQYSYHFRWLGIPIIQYPQDMMAIQELIWTIKPDLIIETGIARGGSVIFYASLLQLIGHGDVLGIDIDIRPHNREAIENHPMAKRITMFEGSSIDEEMAARVRDFAAGHERVLLLLDSNHTHQHVLQELQLYAPLVTPGSYCVVLDTLVEDLPEHFFTDRPWDRGNNPKTAVHAYLSEHPEFEINTEIPEKLQITVAPDGYLKRLDNPPA